MAQHARTILPMPDRVFIQRTRFGRAIFLLRDTELEVTVGGPTGQRAHIFPLRTIATDYAVKARHFNAPVMVLFTLAVAFAALGIYLTRFGDPLREFAVMAVMFAGTMALSAVRLIPRLEFFVFSDQWKRPLFSVTRERGQMEECDVFVSDLLTRIERAGAEPDATAGPPPVEFEDVVDAEPEWKWKVSVIVGAATLGVIIAGCYDRDVASVAIFALMGGPMGVAVSSWMSFAEKERRRRWSLLGVAFALVATALALT